MGTFILNGKEYMSTGKNAFPPLIFSTDEREIGVWTDGKPLYQKCYNVTLADGSMGTIDSTFIPQKYEVFMKYNGSTSKDLQKTTFYWGSSNWWTVFIDNGTIMGSVGSYSGKAAILVLQYTKTTDTPGSGKWSTIGELAHHYSTTEQVVGTWIDGKPVYEKTITTTLTSSGATDYSSGISNIGVVCQVNGSAVNSQGNIKTLPYSNTSVTALNLLAITNITSNGVITFKVGGDYDDLLPIAIYVTIQYTKSTD